VGGVMGSGAESVAESVTTSQSIFGNTLFQIVHFRHSTNNK